MKVLQLCVLLVIFVVDVIADGSTNDTSPSSKVQPKFLPCPYFCINPFKKLYPNPNYNPTFNGCGSGSLTIPKKDLPKPGIEDCCNQHDICYDTCKNGKLSCDNAFLSCMLNVCGGGLSVSSVKCRAYADGLYLAVINLGCPAYIKSQSNACICKSRF